MKNYDGARVLAFWCHGEGVPACFSPWWVKGGSSWDPNSIT